MKVVCVESWTYIVLHGVIKVAQNDEETMHGF